MLQGQLDTYRSARLAEEPVPEVETLEHAEGFQQALAQGPLSENMMPNSAHRTELSQL